MAGLVARFKVAQRYACDIRIAVDEAMADINDYNDDCEDVSGQALRSLEPCY